MLRAGLVVLTLLAAIALPNADDTVSIPAGYYSYRELAQKLSVGGRLVVCSHALRNRAAFVRLKDRSWESAAAVLKSALDLDIRPDAGSKTSFVMVADPVVSAREARWRERLAESLRKELAGEIVKKAPPANAVFHEVFDRVLRIGMEVSRLEKTDPEHKDPRTAQLAEELEKLAEFADIDTWVLARSAPKISTQAVLNAMAASQPYAPVDIGRYVDLGAARRVAQRAYAELLQQGFKLEDDEAEGLKDLARFIEMGSITSANRLHFDPSTFELSVQVYGHYGDQYTTSSPFETSAEGGPADVSKAIGGEFEDAAAAAKKATEAFMRSKEAAEKVEVNRAAWTTSLSQLLPDLTAATGADVVMELAPMREALGLRLRDSHNAETGENRSADRSVSLAELSSRESSPAMHDFSFEFKDGALVVRNRYSFVDRLRELPCAQLIPLVKASQPVASGDGRFVPSTSLDAVLRFQSAVSAAQNSDAYQIGMYHGVSLEATCTARPITAALSQMGAEQMAALRRAAATPSGYSFSITGLPRSVQQAVVSELRSMAVSDISGYAEALVSEGCLDERWPAKLAQSKVVIRSEETRRRTVTNKSLVMSIARQGADPNGEADTILEARFGIVRL